MGSDLREYLVKDLRLHPRVAYQSLFDSGEIAGVLARDLPVMPPFRREYEGAISVIDWDHRLPSHELSLRIYAYYSESSYAAGVEAYDDRLEEIGNRDMYPEFDVPGFDNLAADEAYEIELNTEGEIGRCRLTSAWRRTIEPLDANRAVEITNGSAEFIALTESTKNRPAHLGELEAVSWTPPCESQYDQWTLDVWYLLAFDGIVGTGRSFLVDLDQRNIVAMRDFSVRTG